MTVKSREQEFWLQADEGSEPANAQRPVLSKLPQRRRDIRPSFVLQRLGATAISVLGSVSLVFFLIFATGSPATLLAGGQATKDEIAALNASYGFDRPLIEQYGQFLFNCLRGEFPKSLRFDVPAVDVIVPAIPLTLFLVLTALLIGSALGLIAGYLSATSSSRLLREGPLALLTVVQSTPVFVTGILAVLLFSLTLRWLPTGGSGSLRHLVLPALTLSLLIAPPVARLFRTSLKQQQGADHVRTALSKQISLSRVRFRHIAINALVPVIALLGTQTGTLLGGAVLTETVFGWPGVGTVLVSAVGMKDYPVILATIVLIALTVSLCNLVADLLIAVVDPRSAVTK
jgi:peptide/nickel transport system permease protein